MHLKVTTSRVSLEPGQVIAIDDARGVHVRPQGAKVWITEEGEFSDFVVAPGEDFIVSHAGRTLVQAIGSTWLDLEEERP
jgi:hypothetical protein